MLLNGLVVGSTIEAAYYALVNDYFFIPTKKAPVLFYEEVPTKILGLKKRSQLWPKINLMLGLLSKRISPPDMSNIRITDDHIKISSNNIVFKYQFEKLFVFDTAGLTIQNEILEPRPKTYRVIDDYELSILGPKRYELESLSHGPDLAKELHFYCSGRVDGSDYITDCVVESELTQEQINSFDYSDSMVKFIVERHLTSIGVYGRFMKYYDSGKPKYRKPRIVHVKRLTFQKDNNLYKDSDKIIFLTSSLGEIIEESTKR